jgi:hypothetical protein
MDETAFRLGATHAADWLADVAKQMADEMRRLDLNLRIADILAFVLFQNTCCHIACPAPV